MELFMKPVVEAVTEPAAKTPLLTGQGVGKRFGGVQALVEVSFAIYPQEIYGLIGPNGAGKTTLFNCLTGLYAPNQGQFYLSTRSLQGLKPHQIVELGIARTFQNIRLFSGLSVLENVMVGRHVRTHSGIWGAMLHTTANRQEERAIGQRALELLEYVGIASHAYELAKNLCYGDQRRLEIARALATEPQLLALDEPAAGMNASETLGLQVLLEKIRADGITILLIEHDMKLVMGLCDRLLVLDYGRSIIEGSPQKIQADPQVIEAYLGAPPIPLLH